MLSSIHLSRHKGGRIFLLAMALLMALPPHVLSGSAALASPQSGSASSASAFKPPICTVGFGPLSGWDQTMGTWSLTLTDQSGTAAESGNFNPGDEHPTATLKSGLFQPGGGAT